MNNMSRRRFHNQTLEIFLIFFFILSFADNFHTNGVTTLIDNDFTTILPESTNDTHTEISTESDQKVTNGPTSSKTVDSTPSIETTTNTESSTTPETTTKVLTTTEIDNEITNEEITTPSTNDPETNVTTETTTKVITTTQIDNETTNEEITAPSTKDPETNVTTEVTPSTTTEITTLPSEVTSAFVPTEESCRNKVDIKKFEITDSSSESIQIEWETTENYQNCVEIVNITWIDEDNNEKFHALSFESELALWNITDLQPCRKYNIEINLVGPKGEFIVDQETTEGKTDSIVPKAVELLEHKSTENSIELSWKSTTEQDKYCIVGYNITYHQTEHPEEMKSDKVENTETHTIVDLRPCTEYNIEIMAIGMNNEMGDGTRKEIRTLSEAPATVKLTLTPNDNQINATWEYDSQKEGMECLKGYQISYKLHHEENYKIVEIIDKTENTYLLENLKYCNEYDVEILPIGEEQNGTVAKESTTTDFTDPSKVQNLTLHENKNSIEVGWNIPQKGPECVTEYQIICKLKDPDVNSKSIIINTTNSSCKFENLNYCSNYEIEVIPVGQNGHNGETNSDSIRTDSTDVDEVRNIKSTLIDYDKIAVEWEAPSNFACVEGYKITCVAEKIDFRLENNTKELKISYSDLEPCIEYNITVQPIAKDEKQSESRYIVAKTSEFKPSEVTDINIESQEFALNVSWSSPKIAKYCVKKYSIQIGNNDPEFTETESKVMRNLNACAEYEVTITPIVSDKMEGEATSKNGDTSSSVTNAPNLIENPNVSKKSAILDYSLNIENNFCELKTATTICETNKSGERPIKVITELKNAVALANIINFQVIVENMSAFTEYTCKTSVENSRGSSEENSTNIKTLADAPSKPILMEPEINTNTFTIHWQNPESIPGDEYSETLEIIELDPKFFIPPDADCNIPSRKDPVIKKFNNSETSYTYKKASPYTEYNIKIYGSTEAGDGPSAESIILTHASDSSPVRKLEVPIIYKDDNTSYPYDIQVRWQTPCNASGILQEFSILLNGEPISNVAAAENTISYNTPLVKLKPEKNYNVEVIALTKDSPNQSPGKSEIYFQTPAGVPSYTKDYEKISVEPRQTNNPEHKAELIFPRSVFNNDMGTIKFYSVIISEVEFEGYPKFESWNDTNHNWVDMEKWPKNPYQATKKRWNPCKDSQPCKYEIGSENCKDTNDYCNGPLKPNKNYSVRIRGFTSHGFSDTPSIYFQTAVSFNMGVIIAVIISLFIFGTCLSFAIYFKNGNGSVWVKSIFLCKDISSNASQNTVMPPRISIQNFAAHCSMLRSNANQLSSEFSLLETLSDDIALLTYTGDLPHNRVKNRYPNIKPYDVTRVKLRVVPDEFSDYINASYIKVKSNGKEIPVELAEFCGYKSDVEYIATQGPKEETVDDFWQMVYENDVKQIVMVTNLTEKGKNKCYKYYPEELDPVTCNNGIELECEFIEFRQAFTIRHICLKKINYPYTTERKLIHLQFHEWPDFGVPLSTDSVLKLCREIRSHQAHEYGVVVVHCSAGVGRTGTIIAIDILVQAIHANRKIDVFGSVLTLRKQRQHMVKNEGQYAFIYSCLRDEILNPRVFQGADQSSSYTAFYERGYYNFYDDADLRKLSIESAM